LFLSATSHPPVLLTVWYSVQKQPLCNSIIAHSHSNKNSNFSISPTRPPLFLTCWKHAFCWIGLDRSDLAGCCPQRGLLKCNASRSLDMLPLPHKTS
jgi:hypothetical protein